MYRLKCKYMRNIYFKDNINHYNPLFDKHVNPILIYLNIQENIFHLKQYLSRNKLIVIEIPCKFLKLQNPYELNMIYSFMQFA